VHALDTVATVLSVASFPAMGSTVTVGVDRVAALPEALALVRETITEVDRVCSRFRTDSELSRLNRRAGGPPVPVSPLLGEAITVALEVAHMTGGLVDPTVGRCLHDLGYTVTFRDMPTDGPPLELRLRSAPGWRVIDHDAVAHTVRLPAEVWLDLGASGKAWAADRAARLASDLLGVGVAVDCGGDIAVAGPPAVGGWRVRVGEWPGSPEGQDVLVHDGGLATSGTTARRWRRGGQDLHHIVDPSTGLPVLTPWRLVSVAAASCVEANAAATAALLLGDAAWDWLDGLRLPSRLVDRRGIAHPAGGWAPAC
jgi:thiamine biosynthesis lipoprotein